MIKKVLVFAIIIILILVFLITLVGAIYANIFYLYNIVKNIYSFNSSKLITNLSSLVFLDAGIVTILGIATFTYVKKGVFSIGFRSFINKMGKSKTPLFNTIAIIIGEKTIYQKTEKGKNEK